jgi:hypothetical protein
MVSPVIDVRCHRSFLLFLLVDRSDSLVLLSIANGRLVRIYKILVGFSRMLTLDVDYIVNHLERMKLPDQKC